jgi:hypothetical protein
MPTYQETREQVKQGITEYIMNGHFDLAADLIGTSFDLQAIHNFDQPVLNDQDIWNFNQAMLEARLSLA